MISLVLITGFLGSGKTTFLRHINKTNSDKKIVFLVNDFSAVDVDYQILSETNDSVISVAGGSIFCKCLVTEFVSQLKSIPEKFSDTEIVVIEASGMANPSTFRTMLIETGLNEIYQTDKVIAIVDPVTLPVLYKTLPNIKIQIALANQIILNKIDIVEEKQIKVSEQIIKELNPFGKVIKTSFCKIDFNPITSIEFKNKEDTQLDNQSHFRRYSFKKNQPILVENLNALIQKYNVNLYRIKGYALLNNQDIGFIDYDGNKLRITKINDEKNISIVFIFNKSILDQIVKDIKKL